MRVDPNKPFINGVCFDDSYGMNETVKRQLCYEGLLWATSFKVGSLKYGTLIIARDLDHAKRRVADRPWGETVDGQLEAFGKRSDLLGDGP